MKKTGEHFTISRPTTSIKNLIFGKLYIEQVGEMMVKNHQTGEVCICEFKAEGWSGKNRHFLEGYTYNSEEEARAKKKH